MLLQELIEEQDTITSRDGGAHVILFNDDWHTFEEVIQQLVKATGCTTQQAEKWAWQVHTEGKAQVFNGAYEECLYVSAVLEEIDLKTQIEFPG